jgi:hypothetical protein
MLRRLSFSFVRVLFRRGPDHETDPDHRCFPATVNSEDNTSTKQKTNPRYCVRSFTIMLSSEDIDVWIEIEGSPLPAYEVREELNRRTCFIASEAGKVCYYSEMSAPIVPDFLFAIL